MSEPVVWKHIGLHGDAVGSFACEDNKIVWKSAMSAQDDVLTTTRSIPAKALKKASWTVIGKSGHLRIQTNADSGSSSGLKHEYRLDGFPLKDMELLQTTLQQRYGIALQQLNLSSSGSQYGLTNVARKNLIFRHCLLDEMNEEGQEFEPRAEEEMLSLDLAEVSQCVLPGNNRNEIEVQFPESDTVDVGTDQLVSIRMYIPPDPEADPADKEAATAAEILQQEIMNTANIRKTTGDVLVSFPQEKGAFLTPRGRYAIELYDSSLRMRGQKYDYKIRYDDINRLFLLPKPDEITMAFVIALDKPIRQGQQRYPCLVMQVSKEQDEVTVNMDEDTLSKEYPEGELQPVMRGALSNLIAKTFKLIARKKVFIPGKFANANQQACVKCAVRANEGLLYPLEKQFIFIHKPAILVRFNEVESVEFQRYAGGQGSTRNFDLCVNLKNSVTGGGGASGTVKEYVFSGIDRTDYSGLYNFLSSKKIPIKNLEGIGMETQAKAPPVYNEDEIYGGPDEGMEEESEDEDFDDAAAAAEEQEERGSDDSSEEMDDDELGSEIDDDLDSDLEDIRQKQGGGSKKKAAAKKKGKPKKADSDDDEDSDENDEEKEESPKKKRKKAASKKDDNEKPKKKAKKDPKAPKNAKSAYIFFTDAMRDTIKKENPEASFGEVGKLLGARWKATSPEEKKKYEKLAEEDKQRYKREMESYTPPEGSESPVKGGKKKPAKKKKDPNAPKGASNAFMFFSKETRSKVKEADPSLTTGEIGKKLGQLYKELSAEDKERFEQKARKDKERYQREMAAYKKSKAEESDGDSEDNKAKAKKKAQDDGVDDEDESSDGESSDDE